MAGGIARDLLAFGAFAPAAGLALAAGAAGLGHPAGIACAVGAVGWTLADLIAFDPKIRRGGGGEDVATAFMRRALRAGNIEDVARDLAQALANSTPSGVPQAVMLAPKPDGGVRAIALAGQAPSLGDTAVALDWLMLVGESIDRDSIAAMVPKPVEEGGGDGAKAALALADQTRCDVILPLRHRGLLLGVVLVARPPERKNDVELNKLLRALRAYATAAVARTFLHAEVKQRGQLTKTVDLATAMQEAMMPVERPVRRPDFELRGVFRPVAECGGDLWMWRSLGNGKVLLLVADATGHGAAPALLAAVAKGTVDALCELAGADVDPGALLSQLGRVVYRAGKRRYMMTAFAAVIDLVAHEMRVANAGQNFPFLIHGSGTQFADAPVSAEQLVIRGDTLGHAPRSRYEVQTRPLGFGDRLFLYTDGVTDTGTPYKDAFGEKRLRNLLVATAKERATKVPDLVLAELEKHASGNPNGDDVTMLVFELVDASTQGTNE
ncbi:MAG TPA: SpoIIE family protein phosphatase [Kofleriaceae bacterium]|nr:SpoIIE family protein phosphatase [Kofleriaceae bacterium]